MGNLFLHSFEICSSTASKICPSTACSSRYFYIARSNNVVKQNPLQIERSDKIRFVCVEEIKLRLAHSSGGFCCGPAILITRTHLICTCPVAFPAATQETGFLSGTYLNPRPVCAGTPAGHGPVLTTAWETVLRTSSVRWGLFMFMLATSHYTAYLSALFVRSLVMVDFLSGLSWACHLLYFANAVD